VCVCVCVLCVKVFGEVLVYYERKGNFH
jgi:hypothetical protein